MSLLPENLSRHEEGGSNFLWKVSDVNPDERNHIPGQCQLRAILEWGEK